MTQALTDIPESLWELARLAQWHVLAIDCDLALDGPDLSSLSRATTELLRDIARSAKTSVAAASARPVAELVRRLGTIPITFIGEHGWEKKEPGETVVTYSPRPDVAAALDRAARRLASMQWGIRLTRSRTSVLVWTDQLPMAQRASVTQACRILWADEIRVPQVRFLPFDTGMELRATRRSMGTAMLSLMGRARAGTLFVYVGDDLRDQDAFEVLLDCGYGIRVGGTARPSLASGRLKSSDEVTAFLRSWLALSRA